MFQIICNKLDALSNFHYTPKPVKPELEVVKLNVAAIRMEEVLPMAMSAQQVNAPEELHKSSVKPLRGESEATKEQRQAMRRSKKASRRKKRRQKAADERIASKLSG